MSRRYTPESNPPCVRCGWRTNKHGLKRDEFKTRQIYQCGQCGRTTRVLIVPPTMAVAIRKAEIQHAEASARGLLDARRQIL